MIKIINGKEYYVKTQTYKKQIYIPINKKNKHSLKMKLKKLLNI